MLKNIYAMLNPLNVQNCIPIITLLNEKKDDAFD